jgi:hypothetical protein
MNKMLFLAMVIPVTMLTTIIPLGYAYAESGGPSGQCTCNAASGVMTDHAMQPPFNRINNGCTEEGWF